MKEEALRFEGKVIELLPNATFRVILDNSDHKVIAHISGRLRKHSINILLGDRVSLEMSAYDTSKARIVYRN